MNDKYYVSGVIEIEGTCERVADEDAEFWTVYEVQEGGTSLAICDCYSREKADEIARRMMAMEGVTNLSLEGGWSAKGLSDYAKSLEVKLEKRDEQIAEVWRQKTQWASWEKDGCAEADRLKAELEKADAQIAALTADANALRAEGAELLREHPAIKLCSLTHVCDEIAKQLREGKA